MKKKDLHTLRENDKISIDEFKNSVAAKFPAAKFILYGSKARGDDNEFSDIDILVLLNQEITTKIEEEIFDIGFEIGLTYNIVFGIVVENDTFWNSPISKAMPFHWMVLKEGIKI